MRTVSKNAICTHGSVTLELIDAMELSEVLDYLFHWLHGANDAVHHDLVSFAGDPHALRVVTRRLTAFSQLLICGQADFDDHDDNHDRPDDRDDQGDWRQPW
jgi:hypothetical protein